MAEENEKKKRIVKPLRERASLSRSRIEQVLDQMGVPEDEFYEKLESLPHPARGGFKSTGVRPEIMDAFRDFQKTGDREAFALAAGVKMASLNAVIGRCFSEQLREG